MDAQMVANAVRNAGIPAILEVEARDLQKGWAVKIMFRNYADEKGKFGMFIFPEERDNTLRFLMPNVFATDGDKIPPGILMACWLDAHHTVGFGAYQWNPGDQQVSVGGSLPMPGPGESLPEVNIGWAVRCIMHLAFQGHLNAMRQVQLRQAVEAKLLTAEQAAELMAQRTQQARQLLGLEPGGEGQAPAAAAGGLSDDDGI